LIYEIVHHTFISVSRSAAVPELWSFAMRTIFSVMFCFVLVIGFSVTASASQTRTNSPARLSPAMFDGYEFTLISNTDYVYYLFLGERVSATFGQKKGAAVGLAFGWKIKDGNTLVFTASSLPPGIVRENPERASLQFRSFDETTVVTMDGQKFKRSKFKRPN
jgi:hypothetical protein